MMTATLPRAAHSLADWVTARPAVARLLVLAAYGGAFTALHHIAAQWAAGQLFSLWFPAAGLRFAFLWRVGARAAPAAALAELFVQLATGESSLGNAPVLAVIGIVSPCLVYGLVIHFVRSHGTRHSTIIGLAPLPFALGAVIGPIMACLSALPWAIPLAMNGQLLDGPTLLHSLLVFTLGDMLGILVVAPPLLWIADRLARKKRWALQPPPLRLVLEAVVVTAAAWTLVWGIERSGFGLLLAPILLATCWVGLRTGRAGAWLSIILAAAIALPLTDAGADAEVQLRIHTLLACIAAVGYLAGSFAEAESKLHAELARRERLLFQAERLKTLRAMSVAVIHEISQPLSTISIEANGLVAATSGDGHDPEIAGTARLIARKAQDLAQLIRRLRGFGERAADPPAPVAIPALIGELAQIAGPEAKAADVTLSVAEGPDAVVMGEGTELRQALLNLVRNAIAAAPRGGLVRIGCSVDGDRLLVAIENDHQATGTARAGMGIGLIIARSIAAAHGGSIREHRPAPQRFCFILELPLYGDSLD